MAKKRLEIADATDANLKLVRDEDGTDTSLSLANEGNGAKVTGDLNVTGDVKTPNQSTPVSDFDLATKKYVDDNAGGGTIYHYMQHQWYANASTNVYLPFAASVNENSSTADYYIDDTVWIPMFNGNITELKLYTDSDAGSTDLKLSVNGSLGSSMLSGGAVNCSSDKTVYTFTCDQNNTFSAGDVVRLWIEPTNAPLWSTASTKWEIS